ncbi:MAG: CaiB/BaiF CoA-transferase family protein [Acidocella sp.]|nr:CaiB/BaiF CoA-transferase family protein [Acidocella sp.]
MTLPPITPPKAPLHGIRVLDLSRVLAGPWAGQTLADLGAEVIKVERPGTGDDTRAWGPPFLPDAQNPAHRGESAYYLAANRGKKSITIDFAKPAGQALIQRLAAQSDILLENFKLGGLAKLGLGFAQLHALNPRLIYASITGFGQTGPYAARAGYDFLMQGMGGLMSLTGEPTGEPMKVGVAVTDVFTGMYTTTAILAALHERHSSGLGQHIDIALFDVQIATLANQISSYLVSGAQPPRHGNAHPSIVPYQVFKTADGYAILAIGNDEQFRRFCAIADASELAQNPAYASNPARVQHRDILVPLLQAIMQTRSTAVWISQLEPASVPCGPINQLPDLDTNEQIAARGIFKTIPHPSGGTLPNGTMPGGTMRTVASPMRFSRSATHDNTAPPQLGQHTRDILINTLNATETELAAWQHDGII